MSRPLLKHASRLVAVGILSMFLISCGTTDDEDPVTDNNGNGNGNGNGGDPVAVDVVIPVDFEGSTDSYTFGDFEGGSLVVIDNPGPAGINTSAQVAQMVKDGGATFGGSKLTLDSPINFASGELFTAKVWATRAVPMLFKFEGSAGNAELTATHTGGSNWQELSFDFTGMTAGLGDVVDIVIIMDNGFVGDATNDAAAWTFYIDDIAQGAGTGGGNTGGGNSTALPEGFEAASNTYTFGDFDGGSLVVINNPDQSGINTSAQVAQMVKDGGAVFGGSKVTLSSAIDFTAGEAFTLKVWSARAVPVLLKFEGSAGNAEVTANHSGSSEWQELSFDFTGTTAGLGNVVDVVLIFDLGVVGDATNDAVNWTFYLDDLGQSAGSAGNSAPIAEDFEAASNTYTFGDFDGGSLVVINNPDQSGINTSAQVAQMVKDGGQVYGGSKLTIDTPIDFTAGETIMVKVWAARAVPVLLKFEGSAGNAEVTANHGGTLAWEELSFDFSGMTAGLGNVVDVVLIFDNGVVGDATNDPTNWTFYLDDIQQ